jgi:hypothetical protein
MVYSDFTDREYRDFSPFCRVLADPRLGSKLDLGNFYLSFCRLAVVVS